MRYCLVPGAIVLGLVSVPAFADDCADITAAMITTARTPYKTMISRTGPDGKPVTSQMIQTATAQYIQQNGKWVTMPLSTQKIIDHISQMEKSAKMECQKLGAEPVNGQPATVYTMHVESEGNVSDNKLWISSQHLPLRSEIVTGDQKFISVYDYNNVQAPPGAPTLGAPPTTKPLNGN